VNVNENVVNLNADYFNQINNIIDSFKDDRGLDKEKIEKLYFSNVSNTNGNVIVDHVGEELNAIRKLHEDLSKLNIKGKFMELDNKREQIKQISNTINVFKDDGDGELIDILIEKTQKLEIEINRLERIVGYAIQIFDITHIDKRNDCPICLVNEFNIIFKCGHFVCETCLKNNLKTCPVCRTPITTSIKVYK